jgi:hypothetical protein
MRFFPNTIVCLLVGIILSRRLCSSVSLPVLRARVISINLSRISFARIPQAIPNAFILEHSNCQRVNLKKQATSTYIPQPHDATQSKQSFGGTIYSPPSIRPGCEVVNFKSHPNLCINSSKKWFSTTTLVPPPSKLKQLVSKLIAPMGTDHPRTQP